MIVPGIRFVQGRNNYSDQDGRKYGICIHNTSNDASDEGEAAFAEWRPDGTSSHFYCDDDSVTQSLDTARKAGHAGSYNANENSIAVEITGYNAKTREWWLANVAWDKLGAVLAAVIRHHWPDGSFEVRRASVAEMKANPKVKAFYSHNDCRLAWGGTTHTDPGPNFPWDKLFAVVNAALDAGGGMATLDKDDLVAIKKTVWNLDVDSGPRDISAGTTLLNLYDQLPAQFAQLSAKVDALAARPAVPITPEQLAELADLIAARQRMPLTVEETRGLIREELDAQSRRALD